MIRRMCDFVITAIVAGVLYAGCLTPAEAQNVTCATRPPGDNSNACASTEFVNNAITGTVVDNHAVAVGTGTTALTSVGPGASGTILKGNGASSDPSFVTASSWFDTAFCNTIGYLIVRLTGAWTCAQGIPANPVWWGADPTGSSDSSSAFTSARAATSYVQFPPGKFKLDSKATYTFSNPNGTFASLKICGSGQDNTILYWPNAAGGIEVAITYAAFSSFHFCDMTLSTGQAGGGNAVKVSYTGAVASTSNNIERVTLRGDGPITDNKYWTVGVDLGNISVVNINGLTAYSTSSAYPAGAGKGIKWNGDSVTPAYATVLNVVNSTFNYWATAIEYGTYVQGFQGVNLNFFGGTYGVHVPAGSIGPSQLSLTNSQCGAVTYCIRTETSVHPLTIDNMVFAGVGSALTMDSYTDGSFTNSQILGGSGTCIDLGTTTDATYTFVITGVEIVACTTGFAAAAASGPFVFAHNPMTANGTDISNSNTSATTIIRDNPGVSTPITVANLQKSEAAPSSPAAGYARLYFDSTDLRWHDKNAAGTIGTTVVADTGASNNFLTAISSAGVISKAQPSISNLSGLGTGVATALGVNVGTAGAFVVNGGALGTPSSGTLSNATGLPISTGVSGLGTGVATALGINVGSAGAFVTFNGALGTPSSGTLSNATGLPISTGVSGLGTGVATFLGTPSSANLAAALTDETGSGSAVFANAPTLAASGATPVTINGGTAGITFTATSADTGQTYFNLGNTSSGGHTWQFAVAGSAQPDPGGFYFYDATTGAYRMYYPSTGGAMLGVTPGGVTVPGAGNMYVAGAYACAIPVTKTGTSGSQGAQDCSLIMNASGTYTLTMLTPSSYVGRILYIKTIAAQAVNSASSNVVPIGGGAAGTGILAATAGKWAIMQSDGTNWNIMASN